MSSSFVVAADQRASDASLPCPTAAPAPVAAAASPPPPRKPYAGKLPPIGAATATASTVCKLPPIDLTLPTAPPASLAGRRQRSAAEQAAIDAELNEMYAELGVARDADLMSALKPQLIVPMPEPTFSLPEPSAEALSAKFASTMTASTATNGAATAPTTQ
jgi:hypothetical protein